MTDPTPTQPPTVPEGLLAQWRNQAILSGLDLVDRQDWMAHAAAAWAWAQREPELQAAEQRGADARLKDICSWLYIYQCGDYQEIIEDLRGRYRPAPPTLREQALAALEHEVRGDYSTTKGTKNDGFSVVTDTTIALIRQALQEEPQCLNQ
jgi:hypothetical protein